ncbi:MAG: 4-phosphopantoate--beta-alanine ligase [Actinomycetota bacterium]
MELIREAATLRARTDAWRASGGSVGLVPTMGSLHEGHASLIERADAVWAPSVEEVYPPAASLPSPDPGPVGATFEGAARPGHFAGVLKVVHRLFDVVGPCHAYFGEKDAQQLFLVQRMVHAEELPVQVVGCATVREADGLARSSRNAYLSSEEREQAGCLFLALAEAAGLARAGERDANVLVAAMAREIGATPLARLDYAAVVDDATFEQVSVVRGPARAIVAARLPSARLLDNHLLPEPAGGAGEAARLSRPDTVGEAEPSEPPLET